MYRKDYRMRLSGMPERCDSCGKIMNYSPSKPGYVYDSGATQFCPKCMTKINDTQRLTKTESVTAQKRKSIASRTFFDLF